MTLGRLVRVDLRTVWNNEATDFTPWLSKAENLEAAQAALNIKLDRQQWYTIYQAATGTTLP